MFSLGLLRWNLVLWDGISRLQSLLILALRISLQIYICSPNNLFGVPVLGYTGCIHVSMALVTSKWNAFSLFTYYNVLLITSKSNTKYRIL